MLAVPVRIATAATSAGPVVANGVAMFSWWSPATALAPAGGQGTIAAVDAVTGATRWQAPLVRGGPESEAVIAVTPTTVIVGAATLRGLDRGTGTPRWSQDVIGAASGGGSPLAAVDDEAVVLLTSVGLVRIDATTGATRWQARGTMSDVGTLALADGVVVASLGNGPSSRIQAFDAADGSERWTQPARLAYGNSWAIGDGIVVVLDPSDGAMLAYELASGKVRWRHEQASQPLGEPQSIVGTTVVSLWESQLDALSTGDGSVRWSASQPFGSPLMNSTRVVGDTVVVAINCLAWRD